MIEHIAGTGVLILAVLVIRKVFQKHISKRVMYAVWLLVAVRLFLPLGNVPNTFSIMNYLYAYTDGVEEKLTSASYGDKNVTNAAKENDKKNVTEVSPMNGLENVNTAAGNGIANGKTSSDAEFGEKKSLNTGEKYTTEGEKSANGRNGNMIKNKQSVGWQRWTLSEILLTVWIVGSVIIGSIMLTCNLLFHKRLCGDRQRLEDTLKAENRDSDTRIHNDLKNVKKRRCDIFITDKTTVPCLTGMFHPAIYLNREFLETFSDESLTFMICHEMTHYLHWDHIWAFIRCLLLVLYWWNPLVWIAAGLSIVDSELACDESVIARIGGTKRRAYGEMLIAVGTNTFRPEKLLACGAGLAGGSRELELRMKALAGRRRYRLPVLLAFSAILLGTAGCTIGGTQQNMRETTSVADSSSSLAGEEDGENRGLENSEAVGNTPCLKLSDMRIVSGAEEWKNFKKEANATKGTLKEPHIIIIENNIDDETYADKLEYDGESCIYKGRRWKYLLDVDGMSGNPERMCRQVVLANELFSYQQLEWSVLSNNSDDWIEYELLFYAEGSADDCRVSYAGRNMEDTYSLFNERIYEETTTEPEPDKINIGFDPVGFGDGMERYFVPEKGHNGTEDVMAYKLAAALDGFTPVHESEGERIGREYIGCSVWYKGVEWQLLSGNRLTAYTKNENGELVDFVETPDTDSRCTNICEYVLGILRERYGYEPADITAWTGITEAVLYYRNKETEEVVSQTITDEKKLSTLESWFSGAEKESGTGCPFYNAILTFTLGNGEQVSCMIAEDSCSVFKVNGEFYDYRPAEYRGWGWTNEPFKELFDEIPWWAP